MNVATLKSVYSSWYTAWFYLTRRTSVRCRQTTRDRRQKIYSTNRIMQKIILKVSDKKSKSWDQMKGPKTAGTPKAPGSLCQIITKAKLYFCKKILYIIYIKSCLMKFCQTDWHTKHLWPRRFNPVQEKWLVLIISLPYTDTLQFITTWVLFSELWPLPLLMIILLLLLL